VIVAERALFLPSLGAVLAVASLLRPWLEGPRRRLAAGVVAAIAIPAALLSMLRAPAWADTETLALRTLQDAPEDYRSWWMVGQFALKRGDLVEGAAAIRRAVQLYDGDPNLLVDAAALALSSGRYGDAESLTRRALQLVPEFSTARNRRILALLGLGRCTEAREEARRTARYGDPYWRSRVAYVDSVAARPGAPCDIAGPSP
jgi:Flp pilus assembly protein TadD